LKKRKTKVMAEQIRLKGLGWGWRIGLLYGGFVALILTLVVGSSRQHFDLVSKNYYEEEVSYQKVIDAGKNQAALSAPISIQADEANVTIAFPPEFKEKVITGEIKFYSPLNSKWDRDFKIEPTGNSISIPKDKLAHTRYTVKINCTVEGNNYYQQTDLNLGAR
jgi:nitrogen fixation protein FixH